MRREEDDFEDRVLFLTLCVRNLFLFFLFPVVVVVVAAGGARGGGLI